MYRELLTEWIKNHAWARLQDPCSEKELEAAERYVGCPFPGELKALLRETNGDRWLLLSAKEIIENAERNRQFFPECFDTIEEFRERIDRHIFFATNGCGDYYCYRISPDGTADTSEIFLWEHESFSCRPAAKDIAELIRKYYNDEI